MKEKYCRQDGADKFRDDRRKPDSVLSQENDHDAKSRRQEEQTSSRRHGKGLPGTLHGGKVPGLYHIKAKKQTRQRIEAQRPHGIGKQFAVPPVQKRADKDLRKQFQDKYIDDRHDHLHQERIL